MPAHNASGLLRRSEVFALASKIRSSVEGLSIDAIARKFEIELYGSDGYAAATDAGHDSPVDGVAIIEPAFRRVAVDSLVRPGDAVRVWGGLVRKDLRVILLNRNSSLPEREIFWHEFYHILFSPLNSGRVVREFRSERHHYRVEERRADDFTATMLVPSIAGLASLDDVVESFNVSKRLARHAIDLHVALGQIHSDSNS